MLKAYVVFGQCSVKIVLQGLFFQHIVMTQNIGNQCSSVVYRQKMDLISVCTDCHSANNV